MIISKGTLDKQPDAITKNTLNATLTSIHPHLANFVLLLGDGCNNRSPLLADEDEIVAASMLSSVVLW